VDLSEEAAQMQVSHGIVLKSSYYLKVHEAVFLAGLSCPSSPTGERRHVICRSSCDNGDLH